MFVEWMNEWTNECTNMGDLEMEAGEIWLCYLSKRNLWKIIIILTIRLLPPCASSCPTGLSEGLVLESTTPSSFSSIPVLKGYWEMLQAYARMNFFYHLLSRPWGKWLKQVIHYWVQWEVVWTLSWSPGGWRSLCPFCRLLAQKGQHRFDHLVFPSRFPK